MRYRSVAGLLVFLSAGAAGAEERRDLLGDPLPPRAVARLGSTRLTQRYVLAVAIAADASAVASVDPFAGELCVWEAPDWRLRWSTPLRSLGQFSPNNSRLAFSPDGKKLALNHPDDRLRIWDARTGELLQTLREAPFCSPAVFSADGRRLLCIDGYDVEIWDVETGKRLAEWKGFEHPSQAAWAPGGETVILCNHPYDGKSGQHGTRFHVWDLKNGRERSHWDLREDSGVRDFLSPDGRFVAVLDTEKKSLRLLDAATGKEVRRIAEPGPLERELAFSPGGRSLVGAGTDGLLRVWAVQTGKLVRSAKAPPGRVQSLTVAADGKTVVFAGDADHLLHVWDLEKGRSLHRHAGHGHGPLTVAFSADGKEVVTTDEDLQRSDPREWASWSLRRWDADSGKEKRRIDRDLGGRVKHVVLSPDGGRAGVVLDDFKLHLWDAERGAELRRWDLPMHTEITKLDGSKERARLLAVHSFNFSPDGKTLLAAGEEVHRWDVATGKKLPSFRVADSEFVLLPDCANRCERWLPVSMLSHRVPARLVLLDPATGKPGPSLPSPPRGLSDLAVSPDGRTVAALLDGRVCLLESASGESRGEVADAHRWPGGVLTFSPDGRLLAVPAKESREILLWDVMGAKLRARLRGHRGSVRSLAFSPDSRRLASGASDTVAYVWDVTGPAPADRLDEKLLADLWSDLHSADGVRAFRAICRLAGNPERSVSFLRQRLLSPPDEARRIARLIAQLDDDSFRVRQAAAAQLARFGTRAGPALRQARKDRPTLEKARRIEELLDKLPAGEGPSAEVVHERVIEALERAGTPAAQQVIKEATGKRP